MDGGNIGIWQAKFYLDKTEAITGATSCPHTTRHWQRWEHGYTLTSWTLCVLGDPTPPMTSGGRAKEAAREAG